MTVTVKDIKEIMSRYPDDMEVWIDMGDMNPPHAPKIDAGFVDTEGTDLLYVDEDGESGYEPCVIIH